MDFALRRFLPLAWKPGTQLNLRGPLGHGFSIPSFARKVALITFDESPARLHGLISIALKQDAEVVLVSNMVLDDMPEAVEVQPLQALIDIYQWADYAALDVARENLHQLGEMLGKEEQAKGPREAQVLVRAPMPCGALAECGVCALTIRHEWKMICKDGPVFELNSILVVISSQLNNSEFEGNDIFGVKSNDFGVLSVTLGTTHNCPKTT